MSVGGTVKKPAEESPVRGTVDLWSASLEPPAPVASRLAGCLSPDERARAERFFSARDRDRFVAGRAFLRLLLAQYLGAEPRDLCFRYGSKGKPALAGVSDDLEFNLAHSDALAVCALARGCGELGTDIERVRSISDAREVARATFSAREFDRLQSLPEPVRLRAFYEAWTRKEAFLKALGCGLDRPLGSFDVSFGPGEPPRLLRTLWDPSDAERFSLHAFEPEIGYVGAIAMTGHAWPVRHLKWSWVGSRVGVPRTGYTPPP